MGVVPLGEVDHAVGLAQRLGEDKPDEARQRERLAAGVVVGPLRVASAVSLPRLQHLEGVSRVFLGQQAHGHVSAPAETLQVRPETKGSSPRDNRYSWTTRNR